MLPRSRFDFHRRYELQSLNTYSETFSWTFNRKRVKSPEERAAGVSLLNLAVFDSFPPLFDTRPSSVLRECWVVYITGTRVRRAAMRRA